MPPPSSGRHATTRPSCTPPSDIVVPVFASVGGRRRQARRPCPRSRHACTPRRISAEPPGRRGRRPWRQARCAPTCACRPAGHRGRARARARRHRRSDATAPARNRRSVAARRRPVESLRRVARRSGCTNTRERHPARGDARGRGARSRRGVPRTSTRRGHTNRVSAVTRPCGKAARATTSLKMEPAWTGSSRRAGRFVSSTSPPANAGEPTKRRVSEPATGPGSGPRPRGLAEPATRATSGARSARGRCRRWLLSAGGRVRPPQAAETAAARTTPRRAHRQQPRKVRISRHISSRCACS